MSTVQAGAPRPDPGAASPGGPGGVEPDTARRVARYSGFRPEVQGLRFVAVLLVVVYHVFLGRVSGGVDVFLLISAFFLTLSFVRKLEAGRPLALGRYWLHVFKRLLPLAVLTILGTLALVAAVYPGSDAGQWRTEALASVFYAENWALALSSVDYYAADHSTASPFQHFWSLSVQGQVFLLWPLIFAAAWLLTRRGSLRPVPVLVAMFGTVFVASLAWSVHSTAVQQEFAYFDTRTRLWEFALGSLLALALPYLRPPRTARVALGWAGLLSMVSVGVLVDVQGAFPGWIALWPLLSAAAIIVAGRSGSPLGLDRILASRPLVRLGDSAYALYLIHWPVLVTYLVLRDRPMAGPRSGVVIIVVSLVLAVLATRLVEDRFKKWAWPEQNKRRLAGVVVLCLALVTAPVLAWQQLEDRRAERIQAEAVRNNPGAAVLEPGFEFRGDPDAPTLPLPEDLPRQPASLGEACPEDLDLPEELLRFCHESVAQEAPERTVLVLGNSHLQHWLPALRPLAEAERWRVLTWIQPGCFYAAAEDQPGSESCRAWFEGAEQMIGTADPDLVVVQSTFTDLEGEVLRPGLEQRIRELTDRGIPVVGIRDTPRFPEAPAECAVANGEDDPRCTFAHPMVGTPDPALPLARELPLYSTLDLTDLICPAGRCPPVVGNVYVYWDDDHLSRVYSESAAPVFGERFREALATDGLRP
ncbi:acyltransferase family protein [Kocuria rosea]|uniref:acyltransferase family protein n=1 Tax=Kocuria rosea TaxID=1275 RepID=UPI000D6462C9|nr:acyltransferase family protein [Kocuria rosea]PWF86616.1 acyltransferase [Kocuria rosea]STX02624.1 O-acetyltransferase OatA [Kocuria rosea]